MSAEILPMRTKAEQDLVDLFSAMRPRLPGGDEVAARRAEALDSFAASGLPGRRAEAWKYTDLRGLMRDASPLAAPPDADARARARSIGSLLAGIKGRRIVMVDGAFIPELSDLADLETGLTVRSMAEALGSGDPLVTAHMGRVVPAEDPVLALNAALMGDGVVLAVAAGAVIEQPLQLVFACTSDTPVAMFTRSLLVVEPGASVTVVETYGGPERVAYQVNSALEIVVGDDARVDHVKVTREGGDAFHIASVLANLGARAELNDFSFTVGGALVRNQLFVRLSGDETVASLAGVSLLAGRQHGDTTLFVDNAARGGRSRQLFKSVLDGESRAVFQGRITVRPGAQKTDARMMSRALLLSEAAEADSKPELEIFADDVQCGHGSTTGALDDDLKFYLMARGIPAQEAEGLLIQAFVGDAVETIASEAVREALMSATVSWLQDRG